MMKPDCSIVEDLLPLYNEGLVSDETATWIETHFKTCQPCKSLAERTAEPVKVEDIDSPIDHEKMMSKITVKLSLYQLIFVGISFFLAMQTALLNDSFGFILSYTILGIIMYLFYKNLKVIILVAFIPIFIWSLATLLPEALSFSDSSTNVMRLILTDGIAGSLMLALIHLIFALIGTAIGALILKLKEGEGES